MLLDAFALLRSHKRAGSNELQEGLFVIVRQYVGSRTIRGFPLYYFGQFPGHCVDLQKLQEEKPLCVKTDLARTARVYDEEEIYRANMQWPGYTT